MAGLLDTLVAAADTFLEPDTMATTMMAIGIVTFIYLLYGIPAPYGRYSKDGWGFLINGKVAWFTQELPSFLLPVTWITFFATPQQLARVSCPRNAMLMGAFLVHYFYRDLVFPFRLRGAKPTPFIVWLSAAVFCVYNGYMQANYFLNHAPISSDVTQPHFALGMLLWLTGWIANLHSDNILLNLRKSTGDKGYKIPRGGVFELVSSANYFGEILEWCGWAVACWSLPGAAFAWFTVANLVPRGRRHHMWYKQRFPRYPKKRMAVIPYVL